MTVKIQLLDNIDEPTLPLIFLTKSKNGQTGTATFFFKNPLLFSNYTNYWEKIENMKLLWDNKEIITNKIKIHFFRGEPYLLESLFVFTSDKEWFLFFSFINKYSKETGLFYQEKNS